MIRTTPKYVMRSETGAYLTVDTKLNSIPEHLVSAIHRFATKHPKSNSVMKSLSAQMPIPYDVVQMVEAKSDRGYVSNPDGFVIVFDGENATIYAECESGIQNGVATFLQSLSEDRYYQDALLWDYPICSMRGVKIMMPGRNEIEGFKRFVDSMVFFRHNTLMIEIGGAMEYKNHPEINESWVEYCNFMSEYSGKSKIIQEHTYPWRKNSIHCNNGGGSYLMQDEIKELIAYCAERNIKIIPEMPSTSHCDYMLLAHRELAERCEDPYPDTFCVSNPDSYKLLFELLDEVIDVFQPEIINIGHDEYYSINICDRCRKRIMTNAELLAEDINRIYDYLTGKNVRTMMWCDRLLNIQQDCGHGGALNYVYFRWDPNDELLNIVRPMWQARYKIPKDIICLNWYTCFGEEYDEDLREFPVVFGNFYGQNFQNFQKRLGNNTWGGICSNWGAVDDIYFQRNNINTSMVYNDVYFWDDTYDDNSHIQYAATFNRVFDALFQYRHVDYIDNPNDYILITHTTDKNVPFQQFVDGVFPEGDAFRKDYYIGSYHIHYADGSVQTEEILYGEHIVYQDMTWFECDELVEAEPSDASPGLSVAKITSALSSVAGPIRPVYLDGKVYGKLPIKKKFPNKQIQNIEFVLPENATWTVDLRSAEYE